MGKKLVALAHRFLHRGNCQLLRSEYWNHSIGPLEKGIRCGIVELYRTTYTRSLNATCLRIPLLTLPTYRMEYNLPGWTIEAKEHTMANKKAMTVKAILDFFIIILFKDFPYSFLQVFRYSCFLAIKNIISRILDE